MGNEPRVVGPDNDHRPVCSYIPTGGGATCGTPATVHLWVARSPSGGVRLAACDPHAPIARATGPVVQEHPYQGLCDLPGTVWSRELNQCVIDDSGVEPALAGAAQGAPA